MVLRQSNANQDSWSKQFTKEAGRTARPFFLQAMKRLAAVAIAIAIVPAIVVAVAIPVIAGVAAVVAIVAVVAFGESAIFVLGLIGRLAVLLVIVGAVVAGVMTFGLMEPPMIVVI